MKQSFWWELSVLGSSHSYERFVKKKSGEDIEKVGYEREKEEESDR